MGWRNRIVGEGEESPDQLLSNPRNWRIHPHEQEKALSGVLNTVGVVQRVIVNQGTGFVIDGHLRIAIGIREGEPRIPVEYVDLSDEEEAVVLATFDPLGEKAGTDRQKLAELLDEAKESEAVQGEAGADLVEFFQELQISGRPRGSQDAPEPPDGWPSYDEDAADGVKKATCPECGHEFPV